METTTELERIEANDTIKEELDLIVELLRALENGELDDYDFECSDVFEVRLEDSKETVTSTLITANS